MCKLRKYVLQKNINLVYKLIHLTLFKFFIVVKFEKQISNCKFFDTIEHFSL